MARESSYRVVRHEGLLIEMPDADYAAMRNVIIAIARTDG